MNRKEKQFIEAYEQSGHTYSNIPDLILCCGNYLSAEEVRLWSILRRRVPNNRPDGYYKVPAVPTTIKYFAEKMGVGRLKVIRLLNQLEKKSLVKIDHKRGRGKKNVYQLIKLEEVVAWYKRWSDNRIRSIIFSTKRAEENFQNQYLNKSKKYHR